MSTAIQAYRPQDIDEVQRTAKLLAASGYFDVSGDANAQVAQVATKIMAGSEMGYGPFASVQGIHVIKGKPALSANLMAAAVKAHPKYDYRVREMGEDAVAIEFFQEGESLGVSTFTKADAKAAGTQNMQKFARNMMFARAMSNGVKWYCPDVFFGQAVYTPEELGAPVNGDGDVVAWEVAPTPVPSLDDVEELDPDPTGPGAITDSQRKMMHAVGADVYGDEWDFERSNFVASMTGNRKTSSNDLDSVEANRLIAILQLCQVAKDAAPEDWEIKLFQMAGENVEHLGDLSEERAQNMMVAIQAKQAKKVAA